jgi:hypothetical protein
MSASVRRFFSSNSASQILEGQFYGSWSDLWVGKLAELSSEIGFRLALAQRFARVSFDDCANML